MMVIKWIGRTQDDVGDEHLDGDDKGNFDDTINFENKIDQFSLCPKENIFSSNDVFPY